jgi:hypothetical protein
MKRLILLAVMTALLAGCDQSPPPDTRDTMTTAELETAVRGQSKEAVTALLGSPNHVDSGIAEGEQMYTSGWHADRSADPLRRDDGHYASQHDV